MTGRAAAEEVGAAVRSRKELGAWYTPRELVDTIIEQGMSDAFLADRARRRQVVSVLDPACGDGRFLVAAAARAAAHHVACELVGVDIDATAVAATRRAVPDAEVVQADALTHDFTGRRFDLVVGNPPFLSQMAATTTRGGTSDRSGGPYADAAVEFLALAGELVDPDGGRVLLVLPQSVLAARDAASVRRWFDRRATMFWSWWTGKPIFDAQVLTCALGFEFGAGAPRRDDVPGANRSEVVANRSEVVTNWSAVVTSRQGIPRLPRLDLTGRLGDRAVLNANFRDEYYGMVPAVGDHAEGPPLVTSGLIDPARTMWGRRPVTFAKAVFDAPRIDVGALEPKMQRWATRRLVPKVLVANQTRIIEAVCDELGEWLPAVPVVGVYPNEPATGSAADMAGLAWEIAAVLTSPVASAWAWHRCAGTGLSASSIRLGPVLLAELPWPGGDVAPAVRSLRGGDVRRCACEVMAAYGIDIATAESASLFRWWELALERIEGRR